ncbi:MAG: hypothetical protein WC451_05800 [Patescibacteria group bacterium]
MKWYKHLSKSLNNPFIRELMYEFGSDAYLVFFGTLEIYADNFVPSERYELCVKTRFLRDQLLLSTSKLQKILTKISQNPTKEDRWEINFNNDKVTIFIPKFKKLLDNYTSDTLQETSKQLPSDEEETFQAIRIKNKDIRIKNKEKDIKATEDTLSPVDNSPQKESPFEDQKILDELNILYRKISELYPTFKIQKFFQLYKNKNPKAIIHTFNRLIEQTSKVGEVKAPWAYCEKIITLENMNYNAEEHRARSEEFKQPIDLVQWAQNIKGV